METAIKKAIEGGWKYNDYCDGGGCNDKHIFLDPVFWQALGKAEGWGEHPVWGKVGRDGYIDVWRSYWHDFIDHLALGKDADSFFTDLLSDKLKGK